MKFTVLGATGFIGRHVVERLRNEGQEVVTIRRDMAFDWRHSLGHVIYAIGLTADFRQRPFDTVRAHVSVLADVLQKAEFDSLLYLSSTRVYSQSTDTDENAPLTVRPQNSDDLYNLSKLMGESLSLSCGRQGVRVARLSNVVGTLDGERQDFVSELARAAAAGKIVLRSAPESAKDYIHIDDVVRILPLLALQGKERIYNVASGRQISHQQWLDHFQAATGCAVEVLPGAPITGFPVIKTAKLASEFGFVAREVISTAPRVE